MYRQYAIAIPCQSSCHDPRPFIYNSIWYSDYVQLCKFWRNLRAIIEGEMGPFYSDFVDSCNLKVTSVFNIRIGCACTKMLSLKVYIRFQENWDITDLHAHCTEQWISAEKKSQLWWVGGERSGKQCFCHPPFSVLSCVFWYHRVSRLFK